MNEITCPKCGYDQVRYIEDIACYRRVIRHEGNQLKIDGLYRTDGFDDGENPRLQCAPCYHEWPLPGGCELDFV